MTKSLGFLLLTLLITSPTQAQESGPDCSTQHLVCMVNYSNAVSEAGGDIQSSTCEAELRVCLGGTPDQAMTTPPDALIVPSTELPAAEPMDEGALIAALILAADQTSPDLMTPQELRQNQREERIDLRQEQRAERQDLRRTRQEIREDFREARKQNRRDLRDILR